MRHDRVINRRRIRLLNIESIPIAVRIIPRMRCLNDNLTVLKLMYYTISIQLGQINPKLVISKIYDIYEGRILICDYRNKNIVCNGALKARNIGQSGFVKQIHLKLPLTIRLRNESCQIYTYTQACFNCCVWTCIIIGLLRDIIYGNSSLPAKVIHPNEVIVFWIIEIKFCVNVPVTVTYNLSTETV